MDCTVIIPVGPGHERAFQDAVTSVMEAAKTPGPFKQIHIMLGDDTKGDKGRSYTRNMMASGEECPWISVISHEKRPDYAYAAEWLFFLDADDLMYPEAFHLVRKKVKEYDAIWGIIVGLENGQLVRRGGQPEVLRNYRQLLYAHDDPAMNAYSTLQIGHFVRRNAFIGFDWAMDAGEDWKYMLDMWRYRKCCRIDRPLMINRRGIDSTGPRSAHGGHWREVVAELIKDEREQWEMEHTRGRRQLS